MPGKYSVILADPPWQYANSGCRGAAENEYPVMTDQDIISLPIGQFAAEDCVLLLWATWPKLKEACMPVMDAWGFEYITGFPWLKITGIGITFDGSVDVTVPYGVGFWARGTTEPLLIGRRGNSKPPNNGWVGLLSPNVKHSRKPDSVYQYAESLPGPYLELFARRCREGWDAWGNEIESTVNLFPEMTDS